MTLPGFKNKQFPAIWILVILAIPILISFQLYFEQRGRLSEQKRRMLDSAAQQIERKLENAVATVRNLTLNAGYAESFAERQPYLQLLEMIDPNSWAASSSCLPSAEAEYHEEGGVLKLRIFQQDAKNMWAEFAVDLEKLLRDAPLEGVFERILVTDRDGLAVADHAPTPPGVAPGPRLRRLGELRPGEEEDDDRESEAGAGTSHSLRQASSRREIELAGSAYLLFCQPLQIPNLAEQSVADSNWSLCGLTSAEQLERRSAEMPPLAVLILFLVPWLGLITWPFIKLFLLSPRERFRFIDAYLLLLSTSTTLTFATIFLLDADNYLRLRAAVRDRLADFADEIERGLNEEFHALEETIRGYEESFEAASPDRETADLLRACADQSPPAYCDEPAEALFGSVYWMDEEGCQSVKATVRSRNTPFVSLANREYFQAVKQDRLWGGTEEHSGIFVQAFRSITTGENYSALSIRSDWPPAGRYGVTKAPMAAAISSRPTPVTSVATPPGYGFAVIDHSGRILYHSDERRTLHETITEETEDPRRLLGAIRSEIGRASRGDRAGIWFDSYYRTRPHLLYLRHYVDDLGRIYPWMIVTFVDKEALWTINSEAVWNAILLALLYLALQCLLTIFATMISGKRADWLWPHPLRRRLYTRRLILSGAFALALAVGIHLQPTSALAIAFWLPFGAVAAAAINYWIWKRRESSLSRAVELKTERYLLIDRAGAMALFVVVSILPAYGFFKISWERHMRLMQTYEMNELESLGEKQRAAWNAEIRNALAPGNREKALSRAVRLSTYRLGNPEPAGDEQAVKRYPRWPRFVLNWMPVYNDTVSALRYLPLERASKLALPGFAPGLATLLALPLVVWLHWRWSSYAVNRIFFECFRSKKLYVSDKDEPPSPPGSEGVGPSALRALRELALRGKPTRGQRWLITELERRRELDVAFTRRHGASWGRTRAENVELLMEALADEYEALFHDCSRDEKLVLFQLVDEAFVNPRQAAAVWKLMRRDLVVWTPALQPFNESFGELLRRRPERAEVLKWERSGEGIGWSQWRWALIAGFLALTVFLFVTQRPFFDAAVGFLTALAAAIPILLRLASGFQFGGNDENRG